MPQLPKLRSKPFRGQRFDHESGRLGIPRVKGIVREGGQKDHIGVRIDLQQRAAKIKAVDGSQLDIQNSQGNPVCSSAPAPCHSPRAWIPGSHPGRRVGQYGRVCFRVRIGFTNENTVIGKGFRGIIQLIPRKPFPMISVLEVMIINAPGSCCRIKFRSSTASWRDTTVSSTILPSCV